MDLPAAARQGFASVDADQALRDKALANLDNFEGLAWGPPDDTGVRPLIVVSDDNFSSAQVTAFLFLRTGGALTSIR